MERDGEGPTREAGLRDRSGTEAGRLSLGDRSAVSLAVHSESGGNWSK